MMFCCISGRLEAAVTSSCAHASVEQLLPLLVPLYFFESFDVIRTQLFLPVPRFEQYPLDRFFPRSVKVVFLECILVYQIFVIGH